MTFADLVNGDSVFLDANTLIYHFGPHPQFGPACNELVRRIENQNLLGFVSTHILTEVAHRLMTFEAATMAGWSASQVTRRLRQQPENDSEPEPVPCGDREHLQFPYPDPQHSRGFDCECSSAVSQQIGLLSNDALIVAVMQANGLSKLASNDADLDRVPGFIRYTPT